MNEFRLIQGYADEVDSATHEGIAALNSTVWPPNPDAPAIEMTPVSERPDRYTVAVELEGRIVAAAEGFTREVSCGDRRMKILALCGVCTLPECRGRGYGAIVVKKVLELMDKGGYEAALWQTGVPDFYVKLGACEVGNKFCNSLHPNDKAKNPFWDKNIMLYPANCKNWPDGTIDLRGLGY